jgi:hypothetical protein
MEATAQLDSARSAESAGYAAVHWRAAYWLGVPALAAVAYFTVLRIGLLSDDVVLLYQAAQSGIDPRVFVPQPHWFLYRPLGTLLVWQVGWQLWGFNPFIFHLQGLLLHCSVATIVALWVASVTSRHVLGWLAGALFGVFPLHLEAVGWVAAQWDVLGALFGLGSLLAFTVWWKRAGRQRQWVLYSFAVGLYAAAIFTKESLLTIIVLFPLSAWLATGSPGRKTLGRLALALVPFALVLSFNAGVRLLAWGHLGGYGRERLDFSRLPPMLWDQVIAHMRLLLSPLNTEIFGSTAVQVAGVVVMVLLLMGLARYGRQEHRPLLLGALALAVFLVPVLILPIGATDLQNNRFSYLPAVGYCVVLATLLHAAAKDLLRARTARITAIALPLLAAILMTWVQLVPWNVASVQARDVENTMLALMPLEPRGQSVTWYVQSPPDNYKGAYVHRLGIGTLRYFEGGSRPDVKLVDDARAALLASPQGNAFALSFAYDEQAERYRVQYGAGITSPSSTELPGPAEIVWDFRTCDQTTLDAWQVVSARSQCVPGEGLVLEPAGSDPQLVLADEGRRLSNAGGKYLRVRAEMAVQAPETTRAFAQWFWLGPGNRWSEAESGAVPLRSGPKSSVYWLFAPLSDGARRAFGLRFDPANAAVPVTLRWMAAAELP